MTDMEWLMYANIAVWMGFGLYLGIIARMQVGLKRRLNQMERMKDE